MLIVLKIASKQRSVDSHLSKKFSKSGTFVIFKRKMLTSLLNWQLLRTLINSVIVLGRFSQLMSSHCKALIVKHLLFKLM